MARNGIRSIAALARRTGVHRNTIGRFMWGGEPVVPESVSRILDELSLEPGEALERKGQEDTARSSSEALAQLVDELLERHPKGAYVLFGSRARGDARRYSDFDLGVYSRDGLELTPYLELLRIKERHEDRLPWFIDLVNLNNADPAFLGRIGGDMKFLAGRRGDWQSLQERCHDANDKTAKVHSRS